MTNTINNKKVMKKKQPTKAPYEPKPERDIPSFKKTLRWVMLIEYKEGVVDRRYQKFLFKTEKGGIRTAMKEAERLAGMVGKALTVSLKEIQEATLCRVVAVYAEDVFESWQKEVGADLSKVHIKEALAFSKGLSKTPAPGKTGKIKVR